MAPLGYRTESKMHSLTYLFPTLVGMARIAKRTLVQLVNTRCAQPPVDSCGYVEKCPISGLLEPS